MKRSFLLSLLLIAALWNAGCEKKTKTYAYADVDKNLTITKDAERKLLDRVLEYRDARSRHDFKHTYAMELPYDRFLKPYAMYEEEGNSLYRGFYTTVLKIKLDPSDERIAWVDRVYQYKRKGEKLQMRSKWIEVNGMWYHKYDFSVFPQTHPLR